MRNVGARKLHKGDLMADLQGEELVQAARAAALKAFNGQRRKGNTSRPRIEHSEEVAELVRNREGKQRGTDVEIAAAYLHDILEDTKISSLELLQIFGEPVFRVVEDLTDPSEFKSLDPREKKHRQRLRFEIVSNSARRVKLADMISNLREIVEHPPIGWPPERCKDYIKGTLGLALACTDAGSELSLKFLDAYHAALSAYKDID